MTHIQIDGYVECFHKFSKEICEHLEGKLSSLNQEYEAFKEVASGRETAS